MHRAKFFTEVLAALGEIDTEAAFTFHSEEFGTAEAVNWGVDS